MPEPARVCGYKASGLGGNHRIQDVVGLLFFDWDSGPIGARHVGPRVLFLLQGPFFGGRN